MLYRWRARWPVLALAVIGAVLSFAAPAAAHTGFDSSTPADGDVVDEPVAELVIRFTGEATPAGDGFVALDPDGVVRAPSSVTTEDDKVFVVRFDPPLAGGVVGVRWMVQVLDAHPIEGAFSFTVTAPVPTTPPTTITPTTAPPTTAPPTTAAPATTEAPATISEPDSTTTTSAPTTTDTPSTVEAAGPALAGSVPPAGDAGDAAEVVTLEEFLATGSSTPGEGRQVAGRIVSYLGLIGVVGGLAFLGFTLRGSPREIDGVLLAVAGLGVPTAIGAGIEYWGWLAQSGGTVFGEMTSTPGLSMSLRIVGGLVVAGSLVAARFATASLRGVEPARTLSASAATEARPALAGAISGQRWDPRTAPVTLAGASLAVASFWFAGHTVSEGPRIVHAAANTVHVLAAAVWVGGVVSLLGTLVARRRRGEPGRAAELIVRFSSIATVALTAVVAAGAVMAVFVLDSPGELTSTEWGKTLILKTAAVGLAAVGGAYNHFRLRPQLEAAPDDSRLEAEFRSTLIAEAVVLTFVVVTTAWLVSAAT